MRVLWVCVWPPRAQVLPGLPPNTAEVMTPLASVQEREGEWEGDAAIHSTQTTQITHSLTHSLPTQPPALAGQQFGLPTPCLPLPVHLVPSSPSTKGCGRLSDDWRTNERTPTDASRSLIRDPFPIPIRFAPIRSESDSDRCLWWGSFCGARVALCSSEKWKRKWETKNDNDHSSITEKQQQQLRQQQQLSNLYLSLCISVYLSVQ